VKLPRRKFLHLAAGAVALPAVSRIARAQVYPTRPITIVVPYAAGGGSDVVARVVGEHMRATLGQPALIENVVGAGGAIGLRRVARAPSDGYTLVMGNWGTHVALGATYQLDFDLLDFAPIAQLPGQPGMIATRKTVPVSNLRELIAWLKANQDKVSVGTSGVGGASHVWGVFFQNAIGVHLQFVPYRGAGPATNDLVAGHIDLMINDSSNFLPYLRAGAIKAFAVLSKNRLAAAPDVPTVDEAGLPGFYLSDWTALWAPKGHAQECHCGSQCRRRGRDGRPDGARAPCQSRAAISVALGADAGGTRGTAKGGDREVVANYQGRRHQGRIGLI
jgi:tripartite-type tricarboxylate transporter receptor subunit TctC